MKRPIPWSTDELVAFLVEARGGRLEVAWLLVAVTDLRVGELLALRWRDIDLDRGRLCVRQAVVGVPHGAIKAPRGTQRARVMPLDPGIALQLRVHRERQRIIYTEWTPAGGRDDLVFCQADSRPLHPRHIHAAFTDIAGRAGVRRLPLAAIRRVGAPGTSAVAR